MSKHGKFEGDVSARWLRHKGPDRDMRLTADFAFVQPSGKRWLAPKKSVVNGASIPEVLWSVVGPPFVGDYRRASVIHDVACQEKSEPHGTVHRMFYDAMRADEVSYRRATVMYQAVKRFGPKWDLQGGSAEVTPSPTEQQVEEVVAAAEQAANEIDEREGQEAVSRRVDELVKERKAPRGRELKGVRLAAPTNVKRGAGEGTVQRTRRGPGEGAPLAEFRLRIQQGTAALESAGVAGPELGRAERLRLVDQALVLIDENYVHLPLKRAMHAIDPIQRLRLLRDEVERSGERLADDQFHRELLEVFLSTRDLHTNYLLPDPYSRRVAYLPFLVEGFFDDPAGPRRFLVTRMLAGFDDPTFGVGVELLRWNGVPIGTAVERNGERFAGSNPDALRARGIETLTVRPLVQSLPPDEDTVTVEFRDEDGDPHEHRFAWSIFTPDDEAIGSLLTPAPDVALQQGVDHEQAIVRIAKKVLFAPEVVARVSKLAHRRTPTKAQGLDSLMPDVLEARAVQTAVGEYGYVRIRTFSVDDADALVDEFRRLVEQLPQNGLIIDVRGNGGGLILAGEQLLQLLTPRPIQPTLFQFRNTPLNRLLVEGHPSLSPWRASMRQALRTGAVYSKGIPITKAADANRIGQRYYGPVLLVTDALCYSTTDIFAAGFRDHSIGPILGVDGNTGAGGANVWTHALLLDIADGGSPYQPLPSNAQMRVSIRRTIRAAAGAGTVLEDLGVEPDAVHSMTRRDLLEDNVDLIENAAARLAELAVRTLTVRVEAVVDGGRELIVVSQGVDRIDLYADARPLGSLDVTDGEITLTADIEPGEVLDVLGFEADQLVASRRLTV